MVTTTACFFALRFLWMIRNSDLLQQAWVKRFPKIIDSILLISGITMAIITQQYPLEQSWLTAKVTALLAYIIFGIIALRLGPTKKTRVMAGILALTSVSYIVAVALTRNPFPIELIIS